MVEKINLCEKFGKFEDHWAPRILGEVNESHVKIFKAKGEFVWHKHDHEDELFFVIQGVLFIKFRDKTITLNPGELLIIPKGVEHCPYAEKEAQILLVEPRSTLNTGDAKSDKTVNNPNKI
ncbi:MAG: cupin domain-containing protein [Simkaniaceae bacterium]|nr:cupin domain-containing protein [Simkaniaceae bacterium]